jgi:hypothetical protein
MIGMEKAALSGGLHRVWVADIKIIALNYQGGIPQWR